MKVMKIIKGMKEGSNWKNVLINQGINIGLAVKGKMDLSKKVREMIRWKLKMKERIRKKRKARMKRLQSKGKKKRKLKSKESLADQKEHHLVEGQSRKRNPKLSIMKGLFKLEK